MTGIEKAMTRIQSFIFRGAVENSLLKNGIYRMVQCNMTVDIMAKSNHGLAKNPEVYNDIFSEIAFIEFNISIMTSTVRLKVEALALPERKYLQASLEKS